MTKDKVIKSLNGIIKESQEWLKDPNANPYPFKDFRLMSVTPFFANTDRQEAKAGLSRIDHIIEFLHNQGKSGLADGIDKQVEMIKNARETADRLIALGSYRPSQCLAGLEESVCDFIETLDRLQDAIQAIVAPSATSKETKQTNQTRALSMLAQHPDWNNTQIAKAIGIRSQALYTMKTFLAVRELQEKEGRKNIPSGSKNSKTGDLEAWE